MKKETEFVIICDGLRVASAPTWAKGKSLADAMSRNYPPDMIFTVEECTKGQPKTPVKNNSNPRGAKKPC